ncbi:hypothetical protein GCM10029978_041680 [Actinoallomurus acanthiterrae]
MFAVLKVALGRRPILIAVEAPSVFHEGGVHGQKPTVTRPEAAWLPGATVGATGTNDLDARRTNPIVLVR